MVTVDVQQITRTARSVSQLLSNSRYGLDFHPRPYRWGETPVGELIDDLAGRLLDAFDSSRARREVASYRLYFLRDTV